MSRKVAFVNDMILKTLNQHQQTVSPDVKKAANLDDDISEVLKRRDVNVYDKAKPLFLQSSTSAVFIC